ncbi:MAG: Diguanylate cyclase [Candidatus Moranbacteria bacterium GW2011_GWC2_45_10]|nr:MAG: Diguanylate cyclase [Candidatus Moranbacteria bacterium GW2011_GWC2_45_10]
MSEKTYTEQEVQEFIRKKDEQLARQNKQIKRLKKCCLIDELTGLHRYGFLREALKRQYSSAKRNGMTMVILFMDLDHFKKINIAIGHVRGNHGHIIYGPGPFQKNQYSHRARPRQQSDTRGGQSPQKKLPGNGRFDTVRGRRICRHSPSAR